jgi:hypothetical protein
VDKCRCGAVSGHTGPWPPLTPESSTLLLIVPVLYLTPFDGPEWLFEPKYDGFRELLYLTGRDCHFRSKRGNVLRGFEHLCYWVREELVERDVILDGEVIALDREGRQDFRLLMRGGGNLHYAVFDVLWLKGKDLRDCPLSHRKRILSRLVKKTSTVLSAVFSVRGRGRDLFRASSGLTSRELSPSGWPTRTPRHCLAEDPERGLHPDGVPAGIVPPARPGVRRPPHYRVAGVGRMLRRLLPRKSDAPTHSRRGRYRPLVCASHRSQALTGHRGVLSYRAS